MDDKTHELAVLKAQAKIKLEELKAQDSAKEVAVTNSRLTQLIFLNVL